MNVTDTIYLKYNGVIFVGAAWVFFAILVLVGTFWGIYMLIKNRHTKKIIEFEAAVKLELNKNEIFSNQIKLLQQQLEQQKISFEQRQINSKSPIFCSPCGIYMILDQAHSKAKNCSVYVCPQPGCGEYVAIDPKTGSVLQRRSPHIF
jgi:hypothetical protein